MAINFSWEIIDDILVITTSGVDESLEDVQNYAASVIEVGLKSGCRKALLDERQLEYRLGTIDTFQLAEYTAASAPNIGKIAIVPQAKNISDAQFYENVVSTRGVRLRVFRNLESAKKWLEE